MESKLTMADGVQLFIRDWPLVTICDANQISPSESANAIAPPGTQSRRGIVIMHGLSEHCGRYVRLAQFFNTLGFVVRTYDHRGHGQSSGPAGDVPDDEAIVRDAVRVIEDFSEQLGAPPLLFGHSMGGLFAARVASGQCVPLSGLILSSPALALRLTRLQRLLHKISARLMPGFAVPNGLATAYLTHDDAILAAYKADVLVHAKISARLLNSILSAIAYVSQHAAQCTAPALVLAAADDHIVDVSGSHRFVKNLPPNQVSARFYQDFYHEIFNEIDVQRVLDDARCWLNEQYFLPPQ